MKIRQSVKSYKGHLRKMYTIRAFREAYSKEFDKRPELHTQNGVEEELWIHELGISPVKADGKTRKNYFIKEELEKAIKEKGWKSDMEIEHPDEVEHPDEIEQEEDDYGYSAISVCMFMCQVLDQKMNYIINQLGGVFELDESKLILPK